MSIIGRWLIAPAFAFVSLCGTPAAAAAPLPQVTAGEEIALKVPLSTNRRPEGRLTYLIEPASAVRLLQDALGEMIVTAGQRDLALEIMLIIPAAQPPGPFSPARVKLTWPDGRRETIDVRVLVAAPSATPAAGSTLSKEIEAEVIPTPRAVAPGNVVRLLYTVFNFEETDERVRLRVEAGPGWKPLNSEFQEKEWLIEAFEEIEGEIHLQVPDDAPIGQRQLIRLFVEIPGEPGAFEAHNPVTIVKRGGARPGVPTLAAHSTFALSRIASNKLDDARPSGVLELSSKIRPHTTVSFTYREGLQENLSNFRHALERTRVSGSFRHRAWNLGFGNQVSSGGHAVAGPYVRGRGATLKRTSGLFVGDVTFAQPTTFGTAGAGHLIRGSAGVRRLRGSLGVVFSDFSRPSGGYSTISPVDQLAVLDPDAQEQLEIERRMASQSLSNRVQGMGLEGELRPWRAHHFMVRAGQLRLASASGTALAAPSAEAMYAYRSGRGNFTVRWRDMPPSLPGVYMAGDDRSADGSVRVAGDLRLAARAYQNRSETLGNGFATASTGGSAGLRYMRQRWRMEARGNYRESEGHLNHRRRTVSLLFGAPLGPLSLNTNAEVGEQDNGLRTDRVGFYRGDVRWMREGSTFSFSLSHHTGGIMPARQRADLIASFKIRELELAGGAWATRGYVSGGKPGMWTMIGLPAGDELMVTFGIDYAPVTWTQPPSWRGMLGIKRRFNFPLPFLRTHPGPVVPSLASSPSDPAVPH